MSYSPPAGSAAASASPSVAAGSTQWAAAARYSTVGPTPNISELSYYRSAALKEMDKMQMSCKKVIHFTELAPKKIGTSQNSYIAENWQITELVQKT